MNQHTVNPNENQVVEKRPRRTRMGYKFLTSAGQSRAGMDNHIWQVGETRTIPKYVRLQMCKSGFHWSPTPSAAHVHVRSSVLARVRGSGETIYGKDDDKNCSRSLTIIEVAYVGDIIERFENNCTRAAYAANIPLRAKLRKDADIALDRACAVRLRAAMRERKRLGCVKGAGRYQLASDCRKLTINLGQAEQVIAYLATQNGAKE